MLHFCQNSFHLLIQNTFSIQLINDRNIAKFNETKTGSYRTLLVLFPANTSKISIYGTTAVPEFPIALIAFLISFIPAIMLSKRIMKLDHSR